MENALSFFGSMASQSQSVVVATFYQFVTLNDAAGWRSPLLAVCVDQGVKGTILLATEGINGTIAGSRQGIDRVLQFLQADPRLATLSPKESYADELPFQRMKVKLKQEIVTLGRPEANPAQSVGTYVPPQDWNAIISDPEVVLLDTRNDYEVGIGTFRGAVNPKTRSFREFPAYVQQQLDPSTHRKVAMFCTGGIRCEKASSFLLQQGFETVYHLQGGILNYLETIPPEHSLWQGDCFVFDERVAVQHGLRQGQHGMCQGCGHPITEEEQRSPHYQEGICCPHCYDTLTPDQQARRSEKQRQLQLARRRERS